MNTAQDDPTADARRRAWAAADALYAGGCARLRIPAQPPQPLSKDEPK